MFLAVPSKETVCSKDNPVINLQDGGHSCAVIVCHLVQVRSCTVHKLVFERVYFTKQKQAHVTFLFATAPLMKWGLFPVPDTEQNNLRESPKVRLVFDCTASSAGSKQGAQIILESQTAAFCNQCSMDQTGPFVYVWPWESLLYPQPTPNQVHSKG